MLSDGITKKAGLVKGEPEHANSPDGSYGFESCGPGKAACFAKRIPAKQRDFDIKLVAELTRRIEASNGGAQFEQCLDCCLDALNIHSSGRRVVIPLMPLMRSANPRVRSRAASFLAKRVGNFDWARKYLREEEADDRVRANVIESLSEMKSLKVADLLWEATRDLNNRVKGNATLGLYRLGIFESLAAIRSLATYPQAAFRGTAAWVMGATRDLRFVESAISLRNDPESTVRAAALRALVRLRKATSAWFTIGSEPEGPYRLVFSEDLGGIRRLGVVAGESVRMALHPTDVIAYQSGLPVWQYDLRKVQLGSVRAVIVAPECEDPDMKARLSEALLACAEKNPDDQWSIFQVAKEIRKSADSAQAKKELLPPRQRAEEFKTAIQNFQFPALQQTNLDGIISQLGSGASGRQLLLCMPPKTPLVEAVAARAANSGFTVSVIAGGVPHDENLQSLTRRTNGGFAPALATGNLAPEWFVDFYGSLSRRYEVTYSEPNPGNLPDLRIRLAPV
jgi:HEAT repeat protein